MSSFNLNHFKKCLTATHHVFCGLACLRVAKWWHRQCLSTPGHTQGTFWYVRYVTYTFSFYLYHFKPCLTATHHVFCGLACLRVAKWWHRQCLSTPGHTQGTFLLWRCHGISCTFSLFKMYASSDEGVGMWGMATLFRSKPLPRYMFFYEVRLFSSFTVYYSWTSC